MLTLSRPSNVAGASMCRRTYSTKFSKITTAAITLFLDRLVLVDFSFLEIDPVNRFFVFNEHAISLFWGIYVLPGFYDAWTHSHDSFIDSRVDSF